MNGTNVLQTLTCIAFHLATAFEIIATASTIGTLHRTEFMYNFDTCTLFHKERTIVLNAELLALKLIKASHLLFMLGEIFNKKF